MNGSKGGNKLLIYLSEKMIACDEAGFLISKSKDTKLSLKEKIGLKIHLMTCHFCRRYEKQISQLNRILGRYKEQCEHENSNHTISEESKKEISFVIDNELNSK
jgi:hypothetical protein